MGATIYTEGEEGESIATDQLHCGPLAAQQSDFKHFRLSWKKWCQVPVDGAFGGGGRQFALTSWLETIGWDLALFALMFVSWQKTNKFNQSAYTLHIHLAVGF